MGVCEECWAEACRLTDMLGGDQFKRYVRLFTENWCGHAG